MKTMRADDAGKEGLRRLIGVLPSNVAMIEVGSFAGESTQIFCASPKIVSVHCIDSWAAQKHEDAELRFKRWAATERKVSFDKALSLKAVLRIPDASVDFVYIDANHAYEHIQADIAAWRAKVRAGGWLGGHDYSWEFKGVIQAVGEAFRKPEGVFCDSSWAVKI